MEHAIHDSSGNPVHVRARSQEGELLLPGKLLSPTDSTPKPIDSTNRRRRRQPWAGRVSSPEPEAAFAEASLERLVAALSDDEDVEPRPARISISSNETAPKTRPPRVRRKTKDLLEDVPAPVKRLRPRRRKTADAEKMEKAVMEAPALACWCPTGSPVDMLAQLLAPDSDAEKKEVGGEEGGGEAVRMVLAALRAERERAAARAQKARALQGSPRHGSPRKALTPRQPTTLGSDARGETSIVDALVALVASADAATLARTAAASVLRRVNVHPVAVDSVLAAGAAAALTGVVQSPGAPPKLQLEALRALGNLAGHDTSMSALQAAGSLRSVCRLLGSARSPASPVLASPRRSTLVDSSAEPLHCASLVRRIDSGRGTA